MPKGKKTAGQPGSGKRKQPVAVALKTRMFGQADAPQTAQQSIPFKEMHKDGVCRVTNTLYTKTIAFGDINYQLSQNEDKNAIFESYCDFLNFFDSSIYVQLTFINKRVNIKDFERSIEIPGQNDAYDDIRREYTEMLKSQLAKGRNGLMREKYITFGIEAASLREAKPRLERIEADILANFNVNATLKRGQKRASS